jgi:DNA recombination protein RmuC
MEAVIYLGILIIGYIAGAFSASFLLKGSRGPNLAESEEQLGELKAHLAEKEKSVEDLRKSLDAERAGLARLQQQVHDETVARVSAEEKARAIPQMQAVLAEKDTLLGQFNAELADSKARQAALLARLEEASRKPVVAPVPVPAAPVKVELDASFEGLIAPLKQALDQVSERIAGLEQKREAPVDGLLDEVKSLAHSMRPQGVRGRWGEMHLRRVVETAGLVEHCDFTSQSGAGMTVRLPNGRRLVVDTKTPVHGYLESLELPDGAERDRKLEEHAAQVRQHLAVLASKPYWDQFEQAPEFVVAFLPGEAYLAAALQVDSGLVEYGAENRVLLATPTTLIALLKSVAQGWSRESSVRDTQALRDLGALVYERVTELAGCLSEMRSGLEQSVASYNRTVAHFDGRLLAAAQHMRGADSAAAEPPGVIGLASLASATVRDGAAVAVQVDG